MKKYHDLLELLFEQKNKTYGAYQLRREYNQTMRNSLFLGLSLPVLGLVLAGVFGGKAAPVDGSEKSRDIIISKEIKIEREKQPPKIEAVKTRATILESIRFMPPVVTPDESKVPEKPPADQSRLATSVVSNTTQTGLPVGPAEPILPARPGPVQPPDLPADAPKPEPAKIFTFVSQMPAFPGGEAELLKFIAKNYKVPPIASETGIQGKVFISFVVETDGSLSDIVVVKDPGGGLGREAIRVLKMMPRWKAGNQNDRAVRVRMNLPITVCLQ